MYSNSDIFINASNNFLKFKSEHERFMSIMIDCYHNNLSRKKISNLSIKMLIMCLYTLI